MPKIQNAFPVDTLLRQFITREIASYDEPIRKGRKRGELIGMTVQMFTAATLLGVTNLPLNEIAEISGLAYGSLRNSVKGKRFLEIADGAHAAFAVSVAQFLLGKIKELDQAIRKGEDFHELIAATPPVFNDAQFYRDTLLRQISEIYFRHFTTAPGLIAAPRELFTRVVRIVFAHIDHAGRIAERAFLDRVNEFILLNEQQLLHKGRPNQYFKQLLLFYIRAESEYRGGEMGRTIGRIA